MNKYFRYFIAAMLLVFAGLQYNDPDWYLWMPAYVSVALLYLVPKQPVRLYYFLLTVFLAAAIVYVPDIISWIKNGSPSITGTMQAESPEVELTREFFGLCVCLAAIFFLMKSQK